MFHHLAMVCHFFQCNVCCPPVEIHPVKMKQLKPVLSPAQDFRVLVG